MSPGRPTQGSPVGPQFLGFKLTLLLNMFYLQRNALRSRAVQVPIGLAAPNSKLGRSRSAGLLQCHGVVNQATLHLTVVPSIKQHCESQRSILDSIEGRLEDLEFALVDEAAMGSRKETSKAVSINGDGDQKCIITHSIMCFRAASKSLE